MDSSIASNKFVLPRSLEPFKPEASGLAEGAPKETGFPSPSEVKPSATEQTRQILAAKGSNPLEQAIFGQMSGLQVPLFNQLASANMKSFQGKPSAAEKSEAQQKAVEQGSGEEGESALDAGALRPPGIPAIKPRSLQPFSYKNYLNQGGLTLDDKETPPRR